VGVIFINPLTANPYCQTVTVSNSLLYNNFPGYTADASGVHFDKGSGGATAVFKNNTFYGNGGGSIGGGSSSIDFSITLINNVLIAIPDIAGQRYVFRNSNRFASITGDNNYLAGVFHSTAGTATLSGNGNTVISNGNSAITAEQVGAAGLSAALSNSGVIVGAAALDEVIAKPYLSLLPASPLVDAGTASGATTKDALGYKRGNGTTTGSLPDVGAIEYRSPLTIAADESKSWTTDYTGGEYGDIIINATDNSCGQLEDVPASNATVTGVVKYRREFSAKKWYAVGFPFDIASVRSNVSGLDNYDLETYKATTGSGSDWGDYWVKVYNSNESDASHNDDMVYYDEGETELPAGGYAMQFPLAFFEMDDEDDTPTPMTVTFTSVANPTMNADDADFDFTPDDYKMTANPSLINRTLMPDAVTTGNNYYCLGATNYNGELNATQQDNVFGLLNSTEYPSGYTLKPFESVVVANAISGGALRRFMGTENIEAPSGMNAPSFNDEPVSVRCYNLQGIEIVQPAKGQAYIVREVYKSGAVKARKAVK
jgi:hypothetical protein